MQYTKLGRSGLKVSRICLGTLTFGSSKWRSYILDEEESRKLIRKALDLGINFFDTADMYSLGISEQIIGKALANFAKRQPQVAAFSEYLGEWDYEFSVEVASQEEFLSFSGILNDKFGAQLARIESEPVLRYHKFSMYPAAS